MKLKLLLIAGAALIITSCSKNNDEVATPSSIIDNEQSAERRNVKLFNGVLTLQPGSPTPLSCGCAPGYFEIGPFSGSGSITNFGITNAITTPCVANIPNGLHADTQCVIFVDASNDELYSEAASPYDNVVDTATYLIVGTGNFKITGGTGKFLHARGRYRASVVNNQLIVPEGTATVVTTIKGFIIK